MLHPKTQNIFSQTRFSSVPPSLKPFHCVTSGIVISNYQTSEALPLALNFCSTFLTFLKSASLLRTFSLLPRNGDYFLRFFLEARCRIGVPLLVTIITFFSLCVGGPLYLTPPPPPYFCYSLAFGSIV